MTEQRVTVDFDSESYYLDGEYWESWDNYGEEMADAVNKEFNKLAKENNELKQEIEFWKGVACNNLNFNQILLHELDVVQEQGYMVSDPFKKIQDKSILQCILDLLMRSEFIGFRIFNPNPEDMEKIRYLHKLGFIISYINEHCVPVEKVTGKMDLGNRLCTFTKEGNENEVPRKQL